MIIAVKSTTRKRIITKFLSVGAVVLLCLFYYYYMSDTYAQKQKIENEKKLQQIKEEERGKNSNKLEKLIYREIESAVDLIGQRKVIDVKIVSNRALLVVDPDTNLDALKVRYGSAALIKKSVNDIKIAIDLKYVIESKYNAN
ncbi:hypothetical protein [Halarcobacter ebronensis]|uniref:Uncharacterized protein n=1 Tax=Halarcobacter ebronensis TaxID=1462615 RepID=A0A4Q1AWS5_9BACT|nr:hypothetical protein [Halarcobacter ebronensis]QKF83188.1 hypothetical protein AEBR_2732 [Halarcobacter ebronensis]RXK05175.1 hypothetical protein CRV07_09170 [Halarcobacter ebronensis]